MFVAESRRTSAVSVLLEPTRSKVRSPRKRNSFTCVVASISPISSRNSVPPCASSMRPMRRSCAPVKAPRSWPNSSDSRSVAGNAAQFTVTSGPRARGLFWWIAFAASSLPVPLSPVMSTVVFAGATAWMVSKTSFMDGASPMMFWTPNFWSRRLCSWVFSTSRAVRFSARWMRSSSSSICSLPFAM